MGIDVNSTGHIYGFTDFGDQTTACETVFARTSSGAPLSSFGGDGFVCLADLGFDYEVGAIVVQDDGKIIVGGASGNRYEGPLYSGNFGFMRLHPNGTKDLSFGSDGIAVMSGSVNDYGLNSIIIKPDGSGSIIAVGTTKVAGGNDGDGIDYIALMQLTANGHPEPGFGDVGTTGINLAGYESIPEKVMYDSAANRIVVVGQQSLPGHEASGEDSETDISIHQFFPNGLEDNSFGGGNAEVTIDNFGWYETAESATLSGGWIYVTGYGYSNSAPFESRDFVARVSRGTGTPADGVWDTTFGGDGFLEVPETILSILDAPEAGFYLAGDPTSFETFPDSFSMTVSKFKSDGTRDPSFGLNGVGSIQTEEFGGSESELIRDSQGKLLFAGSSMESGSTDYTVQIVRFNENETVDKPTLTAPIAWSNDLTPTISWTPDAFVDHYILQVNNVSTGQTRVIYNENIGTSTFTPVSDLAPGRYRALVRGVSASGVLSAWSSPRNFEIQPMAPVISSPNGPIADSTPLINWNDIVGATAYDLTIAFANAPNVPVVSQDGVTTSEFTPALSLLPGNYVASVRARNTTGLLTAWSGASAFQVNLETPTGLKRSRIANTQNSKLSWNPVFAATKYDLWVDRVDVPQSQFIRRQNLTTPQLTSALANGTYSFKVRAITATGEVSPWSASVVFVVAFGTPVISGPASTSDTTPIIRWGDDNASASYDVRITSAATGAFVIPVTNVATKYFTPAAAFSYGKYYVWVRGVSVSGVKTAWSVRHTMNVLLPAPTITGPAANSGSTPLITWTAVSGASLYDLQVDNRTTGQTQVIRQQALTARQYQITSPLPVGMYRIWVRAISGNNVAGFWSAFVDVVVS